MRAAICVCFFLRVNLSLVFHLQELSTKLEEKCLTLSLPAHINFTKQQQQKKPRLITHQHKTLFHTQIIVQDHKLAWSVCLQNHIDKNRNTLFLLLLMQRVQSEADKRIAVTVWAAERGKTPPGIQGGFTPRSPLDERNRQISTASVRAQIRRRQSKGGSAQVRRRSDPHHIFFSARAVSSMASLGSLGGGIFRSVGSTPHTSLAYSVMVLSLENFPVAAMFLITILVHSFGFWGEEKRKKKSFSAPFCAVIN